MQTTKSKIIKKLIEAGIPVKNGKIKKTDVAAAMEAVAADDLEKLWSDMTAKLDQDIHALDKFINLHSKILEEVHDVNVDFLKQGVSMLKETLKQLKHVVA